MLPALLQIQSDVTARLTIELASWGITVRSQRKMIVANEVDEGQLVLTTTNGKSGAGCLVAMPTLEVDTPNAPGPIGSIAISVYAIEAPELNMNASTGTLRSAEEVAVRVLQLIHLTRIQNIGTFYSPSTAIVPADSEPGMIAYEVKFRMVYGNDELSRTGNPTISGTPSAVTLTNASGYSDAIIYYTTDGETYPGPEVTNSHTYASAFAVASGTVVRAVAYKSGYTGSDLIESTITS